MRGVSLIDLIVILLLLFFLIRGYYAGLVRQTLALIGLLLGLKIANENYLYISTYIENTVHFSPVVANAIGFAFILFIVLAVVNLIGWIAGELTKVAFLSAFNQVTGAILGLIKGCILVYLMVLLISQIPYGYLSAQLDKSFFARDMLAWTPYLQENLNKIIRQ